MVFKPPHIVPLPAVQGKGHGTECGKSGINIHTQSGILFAGMVEGCRKRGCGSHVGSRIGGQQGIGYMVAIGRDNCKGAPGGVASAVASLYNAGLTTTQESA